MTAIRRQRKEKIGKSIIRSHVFEHYVCVYTTTQLRSRDVIYLTRAILSRGGSRSMEHYQATATPIPASEEMKLSTPLSVQVAGPRPGAHDDPESMPSLLDPDDASAPNAPTHFAAQAQDVIYYQPNEIYVTGNAQAPIAATTGGVHVTQGFVQSAPAITQPASAGGLTLPGGIVMMNAMPRFPISTEIYKEEPLYVNAKQYNRILKRRQARAKLEAEGKLPKKRKVRR